MSRAVQDAPTDVSVLFDGGVLAAVVAIVGVLVVAGSLLVLWLLVRHLRLVRCARTAGPGARVPLEQRLQELDDLHRRGVIDDAEHAAARQRTLTSS